MSVEVVFSRLEQQVFNLISCLSILGSWGGARILTRGPSGCSDAPFGFATPSFRWFFFPIFVLIFWFAKIQQTYPWIEHKFCSQTQSELGWGASFGLGQTLFQMGANTEHEPPFHTARGRHKGAWIMGEDTSAEGPKERGASPGWGWGSGHTDRFLTGLPQNTKKRGLKVSFFFLNKPSIFGNFLWTPNGDTAEKEQVSVSF